MHRRGFNEDGQERANVGMKWKGIHENIIVESRHDENNAIPTGIKCEIPIVSDLTHEICPRYTEREISPVSRFERVCGLRV